MAHCVPRLHNTRSLDRSARSPEHNAILLDRTYVDGGFGFVEGRLHGQRVTLWVGHLARR
jgi:hypothetical protein